MYIYSPASYKYLPPALYQIIKLLVLLHMLDSGILALSSWGHDLWKDCLPSRELPILPYFAISLFRLTITCCMVYTCHCFCQVSYELLFLLQSLLVTLICPM